MKLLGFLLQNKKSQPLLIASSPCLQTRKVILYSHAIYQHILQIYRSRSKVQRTILLQHNLLCVYFISQQYICYVFVHKEDLSLAFDGLKKIKEYFSQKTPQNVNSTRLEGISKRLVQYMSSMEQFLYTRQISIATLRDLYIPFNSPTTSRKKGVDFQIFARFAHVTQQSDRRAILEAQMISSKVEAKQILKKCHTIQKAQKFVKKGQQDELQDLLETDPEKQNYIKSYRKAIIRMGVAVGGQKKKAKLGSLAMAMSINTNVDFMSSTTSSMMSMIKQYNSSQNTSLIKNIYKDSTSQMFRNKQSTIVASQDEIYLSTHTFSELASNNNLTQTQIQQCQKEIEGKRLKMIKPKILQKLQLHLHNGKVKQVIQFGQVLVENTYRETQQLDNQNYFSYILKLISPNWTNPKFLSRRISPNSIAVSQVSDTLLQFKSDCLGSKAKPIIDYVLRKQTFTPQKIPLLFIYTMEVSSNNIQFLFKYKLNQKFQKKLFDVDISVQLSQQFIPMDCKTVPTAHSLKNNRVSWKTKQISWSTSGSSTKAKGKILLAFGSSNIAPKNIIKEIKLSMKCSSHGLLQNMEIGMQACNTDQIQQKYKDDTKRYQVWSQLERTIIIQYKIAPNQ